MQQAQTAAILALLNLNRSSDLTSSSGVPGSPGSENEVPVWKVLVLDSRTKDVLATVLRVQDLRDVGVTLHLSVVPLREPTSCKGAYPTLQAVAFEQTTFTGCAQHLLRFSYSRKYSTNCGRP